MYCNLHSEHFSTGSSCQSCREKLWTTDREVVKEIEKVKASLDTLQREYDDSENRVKLLTKLLLRHTYICDLGVTKEVYKASQLREVARKEVGPNHSTRDVLIDQLRRSGLTNDNPLGWMDAGQGKRIRMTGFVPGGMIETHEVTCRIWPSSCAVEKKCTCGIVQADAARNL